MRYKFMAVCVVLLLLLNSCASEKEKETEYNLACTTYPVYLFTQSVIQGIDETSAELVINQEVSCLHDYSLTIHDMKIIDNADVIVCNGAGLEDFLNDAISNQDKIECSDGIELIWNNEEEEYDPHIWMDPENAAIMVQNISEGLCRLDPDNADSYRLNAEKTITTLHSLTKELLQEISPNTNIQLITFHDGFSYFSHAFNIPIIESVEEEEGSEASAKTVNDIVAVISDNQIPAIFTETNSSVATAQTICRECGIQHFALSMCMSGDGSSVEDYCTIIRSNIKIIKEAFS